MRRPDSKLRNCYPVVMSFMVDYPEACTLCLVRTNHACPVCMVPSQQFSNLGKKYSSRTVPEMKKAVASALIRCSKGDKQKAEKGLKKRGLRGLTVCMIVVREKFFNSCNMLIVVRQKYFNEFSILYFRMHCGNCLSQTFTQQSHQTYFIKLKKVFGNILST